MAEASHARTLDAAVAVVVGLIVVAGTVRLWPPVSVPLQPAGWALIVAASVGLYFRRRFPVVIAAFTLAVCVVYYPATEPDGPIVLAFVVALYTVAAAGKLVAAIVVAAVSLLLVVAGEISLIVAREPRQVDNFELFLLVGWLIAVVALGAVADNRRAYQREADQRAVEAERNREEALRRRATEERLRIARELHDVLGHHLSLINVQASAALHRQPADPAQSSGALVAIKDSSREALRELRATLGVLRQVDEAAPTAPAAGLDRLGDLTAAAEVAGVAVSTEVSGSRVDLPAEIDLAAYRIVQEALTNVTRHAGTHSASVRIRYAADHLSVEILDSGGGSAEGDTDGNGIRGMTERAVAIGGELTAGNRDGGGFRVAAWLPIGGDR
ncbi:sensor histidine kinase [Fodinicola feengrottensis]